LRFVSTRLRLAAISAAALLGFAGCGGPERKSGAVTSLATDTLAIVDLTNPSQPPPLERFVQPAKAEVAPGDQLELRVLGFPELSGSFLVAQDGRINLSLIGSVQAAGKSADELDRDLTNALGTYYRNLDVAVNVNTRAERNVYVLGEVTHAGRIDFHTGERVIHAIADAGGMTEKAREDGVILMRREADGKDHVYRLDFSGLYAEIIPEDIYLQPGDVVFVPKSRFRTIYDFTNPFLEMLGRVTSISLVMNTLSDRARALSIGP